MKKKPSHKSQPLAPAGPPAARKLRVRRETIRDLEPEPRASSKVKGGVPNQTKII